MKAKNVALCISRVKSLGLNMSQYDVDDLKRSKTSVSTFNEVLDKLLREKGEFYPEEVKVSFFEDICMMSVTQANTNYGVSERLA